MRFIKSKPLAALLVLAGCVVLSAGTALAINFFIISPQFYFPGSSASLSPYQVGYYDVDDGDPELLLINPTPNELEAFVVFFDDDENPIGCDRTTLSPNDLDDIDLALEDYCQDDLDEVVVKVVTFQRPANPYYEAVQAGVVGWMRHEVHVDDSAPIAVSDTQLRSLPAELLTANNYYELNLIVDYVEANCSIDL